LQVAEGQYIEDPFVMGKVLHACDPNMVADMQTLTFRATKPIQPNDLLTMDYETTEDELYRQFHCQCKASNCRGHIQGRKWVK
jgi:tyrocidine synthetase-3